MFQFLAQKARAPNQKTADPSQKSLDIAGRSITLFGRPGDPYFDAVGGHPNDFLYRVAGLLPPAPIIFDIGANIGVTAAMFSAIRPAATVHCFEPSPSALPSLHSTVEHNRLNCTIHELALGASQGELAFMDNPTSASASHLSVDNTTLGDAQHRVKVSTLDAETTELDLPRLDFIKIDVEGFECDVLTGAKATLARYKPQVFVEFNSFTLIAFRNLNPRAFLEQLLATFPHVYMLQDGKHVEIRSEDTQLAFIHHNLVKHGCVDDLLCSFTEL